MAIVVLLGGLGLLAACQEDERVAEKFDGNMVLAISWQPAFCETRPGLPECLSQGPDRFDADHFSLHGLWPQPRSKIYCGVDESIRRLDSSGAWRKLDELALPAVLSEELRKIMPGTRSYLDRHEWVKHGTCYTSNAETYYGDSLHLMRQINASPVQTLFSNASDRSLTGRQIRDAFDRGFGQGAGDRVRIACKRDGDRLLISELTIGLSGQLSKDQNLAGLILAAPVTNPGCPGGIVDIAGFQ